MLHIVCVLFLYDPIKYLVAHRRCLTGRGNECQDYTCTPMSCNLHCGTSPHIAEIHFEDRDSKLPSESAARLLRPLLICESLGRVRACLRACVSTLLSLCNRGIQLLSNKRRVCLHTFDFSMSIGVSQTLSEGEQELTNMLCVLKLLGDHRRQLRIEAVGAPATNDTPPRRLFGP